MDEHLFRRLVGNILAADHPALTAPRPSPLDAEGHVNVSCGVTRNIPPVVGHYVGMTTLGDRPPVSDCFEDVILPHLDAAYRLARWLTRNEHDAEDIVQDASLRAFRYFGTFAGRNARAWFLRIVRNTCFSWRARTVKTSADVFDEDEHSATRLSWDPETLLLHAADASVIDEALRTLPDRFRALLVLRELEGLSYQELSDVLEIPIGTVMSGLSRARRAFRRALEVRIMNDSKHIPPRDAGAPCTV